MLESVKNVFLQIIITELSFHPVLCNAAVVCTVVWSKFLKCEWGEGVAARLWLAGLLTWDPVGSACVKPVCSSLPKRPSFLALLKVSAHAVFDVLVALWFLWSYFNATMCFPLQAAWRDRIWLTDVRKTVITWHVWHVSNCKPQQDFSTHYIVRLWQISSRSVSPGIFLLDDYCGRPLKPLNCVNIRSKFVGLGRKERIWRGSWTAEILLWK